MLDIFSNLYFLEYKKIIHDPFSVCQPSFSLTSHYFILHIYKSKYEGGSISHTTQNRGKDLTSHIQFLKYFVVAYWDPEQKYHGIIIIMTELMYQKTLQDLVKGIRANKKDPSPFISTTIAEIKLELRSPDPRVKAQAVRYYFVKPQYFPFDILLKYFFYKDKNKNRTNV